MHTESKSRDDAYGARLAPAFARWEQEPALAALLRDEAGCVLVVGGTDGRVLQASTAAARIADALRVLDGRSLAATLAAACPSEGGHRLVRLRLDPRRIVPPSLFMVARAADAEGNTVYLAVPSGTPLLPRGHTAPAPSPAAEQPPRTRADEVPSPAPLDAPFPQPLVRDGDRFLWRSDEHAVLTRLAGIEGDAFACLVGKDWPSLLDGEAWGEPHPVVAALESRRTFRRLPIDLNLGRWIVRAELSGAPAAREGAQFRGFEGFGVIRGLEPKDTASGHYRPAPPPPPPMQPAFEEAAAAEDGEQVPDASLSVDEHAAFREIARALGARYAGDDETSTAAPALDRAGSVMPFPSLRPDLSLALPKAAEEAGGLLDSLPMAALVHRGEAILAANRPFLDITRYPDLETLRAAGIDTIFHGGAPTFRSGQSRETAIGTAGGGALPVEVTRGICAWEGGPAAILLLRSLDENDPRRELAAERLAREVQAGRALGAEAALDALQAGVVTIDRDGRVVTLNRAAAAYFAASPSEIVGNSFADLFDASSAAALAAMLAGGEAPGAVLAQGRAMTLALAPPRADGHRVAVLHRLPETAGATVPASVRPVPPAPRSHALARLKRDLREPVNAILALSNSMLEERFGALGDTRYRACLTDIRDAGERIVERVAELSDLAAVEAGQIDLDPRPLALNEMVASCVSVLQTEAARGRIVLRTSFSADLAELEADEASLRRAASLVIEHAIRRSVAGGQVIVSTGSGEAAEVALRVRDASPTEAVPNGSDEDLRLALPRALVQANGGRLRLSGKGDDGTLVEILLPARRGARA